MEFVSNGIAGTIGGGVDGMVKGWSEGSNPKPDVKPVQGNSKPIPTSGAQTNAKPKK